MSSILYNKGFAVELSHDYYVYTGASVENKFKVNQFLEIIPTDECAALMQKGRMRLVRTGQGIILFYKAYIDETALVPAQKPLVKLQDGAEFVFIVKMATNAMPFLTNVSDWNVGSKTYSAEKLFMLDAPAVSPTSPTTVPLSDSLADMVKPALFSYNFRPVGAYTGLADVVIYDNALVPNEVFRVDNVPFDAVTESYTVEINLENQPKGFYNLEATEAVSGIPIYITDFYIDANLARQGVFGLIRIKYDTINRLYDTTTVKTGFITFQYAFLARSAFWRYYIVAQNPETSFFNDFDLGVVDATSAYTFFASNPSPWTQENGEPDSLIKINGFPTVILTSTTKIPFSEKTVLNLNLEKFPKPGGSFETFIDNMPNANAIGVDSDQYGAAQAVPTITPDIAEIFVIV
ncbi:MAG: hypothetical protein ABIQ40_19880 [Bacteroidia bacterium]